MIFLFLALTAQLRANALTQQGWNVAATLRSDILPLRALDMAAWLPVVASTG